MKRFGHVLPLLVLALTPWLTACAQGTETDKDRQLQALRSDIEELIKGQIQLQKQVLELKTMMQGSQACPQTPPQNGVVSIDGAPAKGDPKARVTMIEFSDYQCPFCARYNKEIFPQLEQEYTKSGKLRYVFRDFPLENIHSWARKAAEAAHCAGEAGAFWEMHDLLFAHQSGLNDDVFQQSARDLGLPDEAFRTCETRENTANAINQDRTEGTKCGVTGTPTFLLGLAGRDGSKIKVVKVIVGQMPYASFKEAIDSLLAMKMADNAPVEANPELKP
jgi:protein-disulfide isomerase